MAPISTGPSPRCVAGRPPRDRRRRWPTSGRRDRRPALAARARARPPRARRRPAGRPSRRNTRAVRARAPRTRGPRRCAGRATSPGPACRAQGERVAASARHAASSARRTPAASGTRIASRTLDAGRAAPAGHPQRQGPRRRRRLRGWSPGPRRPTGSRSRSRGAPCHRRPCTRELAGRELVELDPAVVGGRQVLRPRAQQAHDVRRAAGAGEPRLRDPRRAASTSTRSVRRWSVLT